MTRSLRFFYFRNQYTHNGYLLARIKALAWKESVMLHLYDITGDKDICSQHQTSSPQMPLVNEMMKGRGCQRISVAAATEGAFPNGPAFWFEDLGFQDEGLLAREEMHDAKTRRLMAVL